jgi:hypothetical protein
VRGRGRGWDWKRKCGLVGRKGADRFVDETEIKIHCESLGAWEEVAMDSLKFRSGTLCSTLLHPAGGLPRKWP